MKPLKALLKRDMLLALRQGGGAGTALGFFLAVIVLLPIGIGPDQATLQRLAPGMVWITLLLSVLLSADRIFQQDYEDGSLEIMALSGTPLELTALVKACRALAVDQPAAGHCRAVSRTAAQYPSRQHLAIAGHHGHRVAGALLRCSHRRRTHAQPAARRIADFHSRAAALHTGARSSDWLRQRTFLKHLASASSSFSAALALASIVLAPLASAAALRAYLR